MNRHHPEQQSDEIFMGHLRSMEQVPKWKTVRFVPAKVSEDGHSLIFGAWFIKVREIKTLLTRLQKRELKRPSKQRRRFIELYSSWLTTRSVPKSAEISRGEFQNHERTTT